MPGTVARGTVVKCFSVKVDVCKYIWFINPGMHVYIYVYGNSAGKTISC